MKTADLLGYLIYPNPENPTLTSHVTGRDHTGTEIEVDVVTERGLTVYLNKQEIVTLMTLGDHPEYLALGFCSIKTCCMQMMWLQVLITMKTWTLPLFVPSAKLTTKTS